MDDFARPVGAPMTPPIDEMVLEIGPENNVSRPFPKYTSFISIKAYGSCSLAFGSNPVADPQFHQVEAGERLWYGVTEGDRVATIEVF